MTRAGVRPRMRRVWRDFWLDFTVSQRHRRRAWLAVRLRRAVVYIGSWWARIWLLWPRRVVAPRQLVMLALVGVVTLGFPLVLAIVRVANGWLSSEAANPPPEPGLEAVCDNAQFSCALVTELMVILFLAALGYSVLALWRKNRVVKPYRQEAREHPARLVETARRVGDVVGRDDLCETLERDMRDRVSFGWRGFEYPAPRPQIILGGVGAGKTAVLVRLTQLLAERGAVPVPLRLRDAQDSLNFLDLARQRFLDWVSGDLRTEDEGDKIWRHLCRRKSVVVLADGLEEALPKVNGRETEIRRAVEDARRRGVRLILTSRPDPAVLRLPAALVRLEPLAEQAAIDHVSDSGADASQDKIRAICEKADVVEMPFYLRLARDLNELHALHRIDTRKFGRLALRLQLLDAWLSRLLDRNVETQARLTSEERRHSVAILGVLARVALLHNTLELDFERFRTSPFAASESERPKARANAGVQLGLVETLRGGVRFPHSVMQAYLASLVLPQALRQDGEGYLRKALDDSPGRELFMALVMCCAREKNGDLHNAVHDELVRYAHEHCDEHGLGAVAAAVEIDSLRSRPGCWAAEAPQVPIPELLVRSERSEVNERLERLERMIGELVIESDDDAGAGAPIEGIGGRAWAPMESEAERDADDEAPSEDVQVQRATSRDQSGGASSGDGLLKKLTPETWPRNEVGEEKLDEEKLRFVELLGEHGDNSAYRGLWWVARKDRAPHVRRAAAWAAARGGGAAYKAISSQSPQKADAGKARAAEGRGAPHGRERESFRSLTAQAWALPRLVATTDGDPQEPLDGLRSLREGLPNEQYAAGIEAALAQGFKYEANRIPNPRDDPSWKVRRSELRAEADRLMKQTKSWYTKITLIQALTLWSLPHGTEGGGEEQLRRWMGSEPHPFVEDAVELGSRALHTHEPSRYVWLEEGMAVSRLGPSPRRFLTNPRGREWISPAAGWLSLEREARRLLGEVVVLLNLAQRGERTDPLMKLGRALGRELPPCLADRGGRRYLDVERDAQSLEEGPEGWRCPKRCGLELCPYPPRGLRLPRADFSEAFCRDQRRYLRRGPGARGRRSGPSRRELRRFWSQLEDRSVGQ